MRKLLVTSNLESQVQMSVLSVLSRPCPPRGQSSARGRIGRWRTWVSPSTGAPPDCWTCWVCLQWAPGRSIMIGVNIKLDVHLFTIGADDWAVFTMREDRHHCHVQLLVHLIHIVFDDCNKSKPKDIFPNFMNAQNVSPCLWQNWRARIQERSFWGSFWSPPKNPALCRAWEKSEC